jgi:hypothetical protein
MDIDLADSIQFNPYSCSKIWIELFNSFSIFSKLSLSPYVLVDSECSAFYYNSFANFKFSF